MFLRRKTLTKQGADTPASPAENGNGVPAAPAAVDIPVPTGTSEPMALDSLTPRDLVIKAITATEVTIQYALPPTCTSVGGPVDVRVVIRPSRLYKSCQTQESDLQKQIFDLRQENNRSMLNIMSKGPQAHMEAMQELNRKIMPINMRIQEVWTRDYTAKCKELLPIHPEADPNEIPWGGWYAIDLEQEKCWPNLGFAKPGIISVSKSPETNTIKIKSLSSNVFYEVAMCAKRTNAVYDENADTNERFWSPLGETLGFSTKTAPWQMALEKAGLRHLIEPFTNRGLDTFESWLDISQQTKEELGIDAAADQLLSDILSLNGIVTPAEQAKIDRERAELGGVVSNLIADLKANQSKLSTGDAVWEKKPSDPARGKKFGTVVSVNEKGTTCAVRWEDPRTKDPANSTVENEVNVASVVRTQFTLFMSHAQADAQNQVAHLSVLLRDLGAKIWFDQDSERLEARDMVRGIYNSQAFLLYLTKGYMDRWFCRMEVSVAKALQKPIIIVYEPDERFGGTGDYVSLVSSCTKKYPEFREFLLSVEAVPMARRAFQRRAVVEEICKRAGFVVATTDSTPTTGGGGNSSSAGNGGSALADLKQMLLDLQMEVNDLKSENKELRSMVEALQATSH